MPTLIHRYNLLIVVAVAALWTGGATPSAQTGQPTYSILVSNDDGVRAPGILAVAQALQDLGDVTIVAPADNQSGKGHSITISDPIYVDRVTIGPGLQAYSAVATPASCVKVAIGGLMSRKPDLVVSGINRGYNLGMVTYVSGTLGAAREAALMGIPAVAASLTTEESDYQPAAQIVRRVVELGEEAGARARVVSQRQRASGDGCGDQGPPDHASKRDDGCGTLRGAEVANRTAILLERVERADRRRGRHRRVGHRSRLRRCDAAQSWRVRCEDLRGLAFGGHREVNTPTRPTSTNPSVRATDNEPALVSTAPHTGALPARRM